MQSSQQRGREGEEGGRKRKKRKEEGGRRKEEGEGEEEEEAESQVHVWSICNACIFTQTRRTATPVEDLLFWKVDAFLLVDLAIQVA